MLMPRIFLVFTVANRMSQTDLHQFVHDFRTPLSIISMGVEALKNARHDEAQFAQISMMILEEGVKPLDSMISMLGNEPNTIRPR